MASTAVATTTRRRRQASRQLPVNRRATDLSTSHAPSAPSTFPSHTPMWAISSAHTECGIWSSSHSRRYQGPKWHEYQMPHSVCAEEIAHIGVWLGKVLGAD